MSTAMRVTLDGAEALQQKLGRLGESMKDLRPFWIEVAAPMLSAHIAETFSTEGRSVGQPWAKLSPKYAAWKQKHFPGTAILQRLGLLRESLVWSGSERGIGGVFEATETSMTYGTAVEYGAFHQHGTSRMPSRPFLVTPDLRTYAEALKVWAQARATEDMG